MLRMSRLRQGLALVATMTLCAAPWLIPHLSSPAPARSWNGDQEKPTAHVLKAWPRDSAALSRNRVNTLEKDIPTDWSNEEDDHKNIKWVVNLGSKALGGPVLANGCLFVGTNN